MIIISHVVEILTIVNKDICRYIFHVRVSDLSCIDLKSNYLHKQMSRTNSSVAVLCKIAAVT